jgi:hypothetical protein
MIDLHMHSTASDGQYTPEELVTKAQDTGVTMMALTDHDTIDGVERAEAQAKKLGMEFIPGIEISLESEAEMHMLGFYIDIESEGIRAACQKFVQLRNERTLKIIEFLKKYDIHITKEEVEAKSGSDVVARPHFARVMLEKGYVQSISEAFDKYLGTKEFSTIERPKPSAEEGIRMIHEAGGLALLAHPISLKQDEEGLDALVGSLKEMGLDGIETYYSTHSDEQIRQYHALAVKYGLIETIGSDFHGEKVKPDIFIGKRIHGEELLASEEVQEQIRKELLLKKK